MSDNLPALIDKMEPEFKKALGNSVPSSRFTRIARTAVQSNPEAMAADRTSLFIAITKAAQDQLVIDGREAALVMYKGQAQYMPMVAGLLKKMRQHPNFAGLTHGIVYENEFNTGAFKYTKGDNEELHHEPMVFGDRGEKIGAYAVLSTKDGEKFRCVMSKDEILKHKAASRGGSSPHGPWAKWEEDMWIKTVIRKLYKTAPNSGDVFGVLDGVFDDEQPKQVSNAPQEQKEVSPQTDEDTPKKTRAASVILDQDAEDGIDDAEVIPSHSEEYDDEIPM